MNMGPTKINIVPLVGDWRDAQKPSKYELQKCIDDLSKRIIEQDKTIYQLLEEKGQEQNRITSLENKFQCMKMENEKLIDHIKELESGPNGLYGNSDVHSSHKCGFHIQHLESLNPMQDLLLQTVDDLTLARERTKNECLSLKNMYKSEKEKREEIENPISSLTCELNECMEENFNLKLKLSRSEHIGNIQDTQLQRNETNLEEEQEKHEKHVKWLQTKLTGMEALTKVLKATKGTSAGKLQSAQAISNENQSLKQEIDSLNQCLQNQLSDRDKEIKRLQNRFGQNETENQHLQNELNGKNSENEQLHKDLDHKAKENQQFQNELSNKKAENARLYKDLWGKDREINRLHNELSDKDTENQCLRNEFSGKETDQLLKREIDSLQQCLQNELIDKNIENQRLRCEFRDKLCKDNDLPYDEFSITRRSLLDKNNTIKDLDRQNQTLQSEVQVYNKEFESLKRKMKNVLEEQLNEMKEMEDEIKAQKQVIKQLKEKSGVEFQGRINQISELDTENQRLQNELSDMDTHNQLLQCELRQKEVENQYLHKELSSKDKANQCLLHELSDKGIENQWLQTKFKGKEAAFNELKSSERTSAEKLQSAQDICKENQLLKQKINTLNQQACQQEDTEKQKVSTYQAKIDQYKRKTEELNHQLKEVQQESDNKEQHLTLLARMDRQIEELPKRLVAEMSTKVSSDKRVFENVSVKNRPMNIAAEYEMICSNEWHDGKNELDEMCPMMSEGSKVKLLRTVFEVSENEALQRIRFLMSQIHTMISAPFTASSSSGKQSSVDKDINVFIGDKLRCTADNADMTSMSELVKQKIVNLPYSTKTNKKLNRFIDAAARVTWKMVLQRPPMYFRQAGTGEKWQGENKQELCCNSSDPHDLLSKVKYYVHPTLYHGESVMVKGRVMLAKV